MTVPDAADANALPSQARDLARAEGGGTYARPMYFDADQQSEFTVSDRLLVKTHATLTAAQQRTLAGRIGATVVDTRTGNVLILQLRDAEADPFAAVTQLAARAEVAWAEPEFLFQPQKFFTPNDPFFSRQQHLNNTGQNGGLSGADVNATEAWDLTQGDTSIVIAILDDGVQTTHPDLRIAPGGRNYFADPVTSDPTPTDSLNSHGTAVAGVAAARGNNGIGVTGMAPNARILPIKLFQGLAFTTNTAAGDAIRYAADAGADVISNSWGGGASSNFITDAIVYASTQGRGGKGAPVFFASGNGGEMYGTYNIRPLSVDSTCVDCVISFTYHKNGSGTAGLDMASIDNISVVSADGYTVLFSETFANGLPAGWSTSGSAGWISTSTTYQSGFGDNVSMQSGAIGHSQSSVLTMPARTFQSGERVYFRLRRSSAGGDSVRVRRFRPANNSTVAFPLTGGIDVSSSVIHYPASADSSIAIGASTDRDFRAGYSQFDTLGTAKSVDLVAPSNGGWNNVTTTDRTGLTGATMGYTANSDYTFGFSGTSAATPVASGIAALMLSKNPGLTRNQVLSILRSSAAKIGSRPYVGGKNIEYGYGRVDAQAALLATPEPTPVISYATPHVFPAGVAISTITPTSTGGAPDSWSVSPALPGGLTLNTGTGAITGTPALSAAAANYSVIAQNSSGADTAVLNIAVTLAKPTSLNYTLETATYGKNVEITANTATVGGGTESILFSLNSGTLPAGLSLHSSTGAITGKPLAAGAFTPTIRIANDSGFADRTLSITVNGFTYGSASVQYTKNTPISANVPGGVAGSSGNYTVDPALPTGLSLDATTGAITGTPTVLVAAAPYVVSRDFTGATAEDTVRIAVLDTAPTTLTYSVNPGQYSLGQGITLNKTTVTGGNANLTYTIASGALPAGLNIGTNTGTLFGTPSVLGNFSATIRATNSGGFTETVLLLSVRAPQPAINYPADSAAFTMHTTIEPFLPANSGGSVLSWSIAPNLSAATGLQFNGTTGRITGTPVYQTAPTRYIVTANGFGGSQGLDTIFIATTTPAPTVTYADAPVAFELNVDATPLLKSGKTGIVTSYSISPALPAGLMFSTITGAISGRPSAISASAAYEIRANGPGGSGADTVTLSVVAAAPTVSYTNAPVTFELNVPASLAKLSKTGVVTSYGIAPALPSGLVFSPITGAISGSATVVSAETEYVVTATGPGGAGFDTLRIAVTTPVPTVSYTDTVVLFALRVPATPLMKLSASGKITGYSIQPALPAGLTFSTFTGAIGGTPEALSTTTDYVISATGPGGTGKDTVRLAVTTPAPTLSYANAPLSFTVGMEISSISKVGTTGIITGYGVSPALPAGLAINTTTGRITGIPSAPTATAAYEITATGPGGTGRDTLTITVNGNPPVLAFNQDSVAFVIRAEITAFRPTNSGGPIIGWSITDASNGKSLTANTGLLFNPTTGKILGTPVYLSAPRTYSVIARGLGGVADTIPLVISILPPPPKVGAGTGVALVLRVNGRTATYSLPLPTREKSDGSIKGTINGSITVAILDLSGRTVWSATHSERDGLREIVWDGKDAGGRSVSAGMYTVRVRRSDAGASSGSSIFPLFP